MSMNILHWTDISGYHLCKTLVHKWIRPPACPLYLVTSFVAVMQKSFFPPSDSHLQATEQQIIISFSQSSFLSGKSLRFSSPKEPWIGFPRWTAPMLVLTHFWNLDFYLGFQLMCHRRRAETEKQPRVSLTWNHVGGWPWTDLWPLTEAKSRTPT